MKKIISNILAIFLTLCMSLSFVGCGKETISEGPIPNGIYVYSGKKAEFLMTYVYTESNDAEFYWKIDGNKAESWGSGSRGMVAKIIKKDGKIYFERRKWRDALRILFFGGEFENFGRSYIVEHNEQEKSITVELYKKGE